MSHQPKDHSSEELLLQELRQFNSKLQEASTHVGGKQKLQPLYPKQASESVKEQLIEEREMDISGPNSRLRGMYGRC